VETQLTTACNFNYYMVMTLQHLHKKSLNYTASVSRISVTAIIQY